jgi:transposase InsO family protein
MPKGAPSLCGAMPNPENPNTSTPSRWTCSPATPSSASATGYDYLVTFIDPVSHFAFAWAVASKRTRHTAQTLALGLSILPAKPMTLLSDNGSEFEAEFAQVLKEHGIARWCTYPNTPKMNAHAERFNRTLQESFVDYHEDLLFTDLALFNRKLADWLVFYNAYRPHYSSVRPYNSSSNTTPSAKGGGLILFLTKASQNKTMRL